MQIKVYNFLKLEIIYTIFVNFLPSKGLEVRGEKPNPGDVLRASTGRSIEQCSSPVKGREEKPNPGPSPERVRGLGGRG